MKLLEGKQMGHPDLCLDDGQSSHPDRDWQSCDLRCPYSGVRDQGSEQMIKPCAGALEAAILLQARQRCQEERQDRLQKEQNEAASLQRMRTSTVRLPWRCVMHAFAVL